MPALVDTRGLPLARSVHQRLARIALIERLTAEPNLTEVAIDDERELGTVTRIDQIPDDERERLLAAIAPARPLDATDGAATVEGVTFSQGARDFGASLFPG